LGAITADQFRIICNGVWNDRAGVLADRGSLSGESALMRAVYWRLCKNGAVYEKAESYSLAETALTYEKVIGCVLEFNATPHFDGAPFLQELRKLYENEASRD
jgi:hypothetical protein